MLAIVRCVILACCVGAASSSHAEYRLVKKLLHNYNPLIRPVENKSQVLKVYFGTALYRLIDVNERIQVIKCNMWLRVRWRDYQLQWDPKDFGGIQGIRVDSKEVWLPDIVMFNNADGNYEARMKPRIVLDNFGEILWIPISIYKASCTIDVRYFPFDQQECELKFGSWTFNGNELELDWYSGPFMDLNDYEFSGTWDIVDCPARIVVVPETPHSPKQTMVLFKLVIRRKTLFYIVNLIMPCVLTSFLSICVFYLPSIAGEKMTLSISILISLVVFLILLQKSLPPAAELPLLANYLLFTFVLNIISIFLTVIIINWSFRTSHTHVMPRWIKILLLGYLPKMLLIKRPDHERWRRRLGEGPEKRLTSALGQIEQVLEQQALLKLRHPDYSLDQMLDAEHMQHCLRNRQPAAQLPQLAYAPADDEDQVLRKRKKEALKSLEFVVNHIKRTDQLDETVQDWQFAGIVMDRLLLIIFLAVTIIGTIKILIDNPYIFEISDQEKVRDRVAHQLEEYKKLHDPA